MCGRYSLFIPLVDLIGFFNLSRQFNFDLEPRYNIAPRQDVLAIRAESDQRHLVNLRWGLIPSWAKDDKIGYKTINARSEAAHNTASFRAAFRARRCLLPASGFFEWQKQGKEKQPYYFQRGDGNPMALAGLWESWLDRGEGRVVESCTILTTDSNELVGQVHHRMPVILEPEDFDSWLDPKEHQVDRLLPLLQPAAPGVLDLYPVSRYINQAANEGPQCVEPVDLGE